MHAAPSQVRVPAWATAAAARASGAFGLAEFADGAARPVT